MNDELREQLIDVVATRVNYDEAVEQKLIERTGLPVWRNLIFWFNPSTNPPTIWSRPADLPFGEAEQA